MLFGGAALVLGRQSPEAVQGIAKYFTHAWGLLAESTVRPIVEYLRSLARKREPPPELPTFGQPPSGL